MFSRSRLTEKLNSEFDFSVIPPNLEKRARELAAELPFDEMTYLTKKLFFVRGSELWPIIEPLSREDQCRFMRCSSSLFSKVKNNQRSANSKLGRPTKLTSKSTDELVKWLDERIARKDYPTKREFKEKCHFFLHNQNTDYIFSKNYFDTLLKRIAPEYTVKLAQPVEFDRALLERSSIEAYFKIIREFNIEQTHPELIINLDETGFGGSTSKRMKSVKVIVPKDHQGDLHVQDVELTSHITSLVGITAAGTMLQPCSIITRETEHPDGSKCPYYNKMKIYSTTNAFITRNVFESYFGDVVFPYITKIRSQIGSTNEPAIIIYDGLKGHLSDHIFSQAATFNVNIIVLPSHSSHILQPLDQGFFRSLKSKYSRVQPFPNVSKISTRLQKIFTALEECDNCQLIVQSWAHAGIHPVIEDGIVQRVVVDESEILNSEVVAELPNEEINERARGRRPSKGQYGLMNAEQIERVKNGLCPFCGLKKPTEESEQNEDDQ